MEKAVSPECRIKAKVWARDASGAMNLKNYKKWLNAFESETKNTRAIIDVVAVVALRSVLNIAKKFPSTRWGFKVKPDRSFESRHQVILG